MKPAKFSPLVTPQPASKKVLSRSHNIRQLKSGAITNKTRSTTLQAAQRKASITKALEEARETCKDCHPLTPMACVTGCNVWKLRNELRRLGRKIKNPNFSTNLLNTLKNGRRLQLLEILSKGQYSIDSLQQELKKSGYYHSQQTIAQEYINHLEEVGLVEENHHKYRTTMFGQRLNELMKGFRNIGELLPPHSECYEEETVKALLENPKTYEELDALIRTESLSRVLKRLHAANLIAKNNENNYVFYFRTKREPQKEKLSPTEKRVHQSIPEGGITAEELTNNADISLRRTYKYLRRLRGKKLAFKRRRLKVYALTEEGAQIARLLGRIHKLLTEFKEASTELTTESLRTIQQTPLPNAHRMSRKEPQQILTQPEAWQKSV